MQRAAAALSARTTSAASRPPARRGKTSIRTVFDLRVERGREGARARSSPWKSRPTASSTIWSARSSARWSRWAAAPGRGRGRARCCRPTDRRAPAGAGTAPPQGLFLGRNGATVLIRDPCGSVPCVSPTSSPADPRRRQENVVLCCEDLLRDYGDDVLLITGPALGTGRKPARTGQGRGGAAGDHPALRRAIHPWRDLVAYRADSKRHCGISAPTSFIPTVPKAASSAGPPPGVWAFRPSSTPCMAHRFIPTKARWRRALFRGCERWAARRCHGLVSVADAMTDLLVAAGVAPREKFTTIYSGMEVEPLLESHRLRDAVRSKLGYRPEHVVIGKIARLFHLKGHEYLIEAAKRLVRRHAAGAISARGRRRAAGPTRTADSRGRPGRAFPTSSAWSRRRKSPAWSLPWTSWSTPACGKGLPGRWSTGPVAGKPVVSFDIDGAREVVLDDHHRVIWCPPKTCGAWPRHLIDLSAILPCETAWEGRGGGVCRRFRTSDDSNSGRSISMTAENARPSRAEWSRLPSCLDESGRVIDGIRL